MKKLAEKQMSEVRKYLSEEKLSLDTNSEKGDKTLECPSCRMKDFVHAGGICKLGIWRELIFDLKGKKRG